MSARSLNRSLRDGEGDEEKALSVRLRAGKSGKPPRIGARLDARMKSKPGGGAKGARVPRQMPATHASDPRQRAIVKVHYYKHAGGGAAALGAHGAYIEREGAQLADEVQPHADYLNRDGQQGFYDAGQTGVDGRERLEQWGREDGRHFRIILSPENGQAMADLTGYTREVMARAEAELGKPLQWVAVNHWDTDNPHTHIVLRGRDGLGAPLVRRQVL